MDIRYRLVVDKKHKKFQEQCNKNGLNSNKTPQLSVFVIWNNYNKYATYLMLL